MEALLLLTGGKMRKGHVGDVEWEVLDVAPDGREFFRVTDAGKKVLIEGEVDGPRVYFDVEGMDREVVKKERRLFERELVRLGKLDEPLDEILHEIADDLAFTR